MISVKVRAFRARTRRMGKHRTEVTESQRGIGLGLWLKNFRVRTFPLRNTISPSFQRSRKAGLLLELSASHTRASMFTGDPSSTNPNALCAMLTSNHVFLAGSLTRSPKIFGHNPNPPL
jgi:hypothetical protein